MNALLWESGVKRVVGERGVHRDEQVGHGRDTGVCLCWDGPPHKD